jgi:hypothetical protein
LSFKSPRRSTLPRPWLYVAVHRGYIAIMRIYADIERPAPRKLKPAIEALQRGEVIVYHRYWLRLWLCALKREGCRDNPAPQESCRGDAQTAVDGGQRAERYQHLRVHG